MAISHNNFGDVIGPTEWNGLIDVINLILTSIDAVGHVKRTSRTLSTTQTILVTDDWIAVDTSSADVALALPSALLMIDRDVEVDWYAGTHTLTVIRSGGDLIYPVSLTNGTTFTFELVGQAQKFHSNGFGWFLV